MQSKEEFLRFLGEGAYGYVHLVKFTNPDSSSSFQAAVKSCYETDYESLRKELQILSQLRGYPRIVNCLGDSLEEGLSSYGNKVHKLLLEYASEGSLNAFMENHTDRKLPESMIKDFTRMILEGLVTIHDHGFVHCDLKSDNLLVFPRRDSSYELKISDFGNALQVGEVPDFWETDFPFVGTPNYMPPESLRDGVAKKTLDLWSVGCLVLEMYTGVIPWEGVKLSDLTTRLLDGKAPEIPESLPCDAKEFIDTCFSRKPEERGSACHLLCHGFLKEDEKQTAKVNTTEETRNSFLLKLKLRIRRVSKKSKDDVSEKKMKPLPAKPPQFKRTLNKIFKLKILPVKISASNLVYVH